MADEDALLALLTRRTRGALATIKRDGLPQLSTLDFLYEPAKHLIRISVTDGRAKTTNLRRDPRASLYVSTPEGWAWTVAECTAELTSVATDTHDDTVEELVEVYQRLRGAHPDWQEYREAMVDDQRLVLRLHVQRAYGQPEV